VSPPAIPCPIPSGAKAGATGRSSPRFTYDSTLDEVQAATQRLHFDAEPVDPQDPTSPWLTARPKALKAIRKVLGKSDYEAHEGVNTGGANAVYWVEKVLERPDGLVVVRNLVEGAKIKVDEVTEPIEPDLLYPLLRGRDVQRWRAEPSALILMVQDPVKRRGIDEKELQMRCPRTYGYLKRFEPVLRQRAAFKRYFRPERGGKEPRPAPSTRCSMSATTPSPRGRWCGDMWLLISSLQWLRFTMVDLLCLTKN
jgi:hypothetical protein